MPKLLHPLLWAGIASLTAGLCLGQEPRKPAETEAGIPVTDKLTIAKCGGCHQPDKGGNLSRISWIRTSPEGWQEAIKRMVRLNGLVLAPAEARQIVTYLATSHGLAPEEAKAGAWHTEKRQIEKEEYPSDAVRDACGACHPIARPNTWRRSANEWKELVNMHLGYFPVVEYTSFRRRGGGRAAARAGAPPAAPGSDRDPVDVAAEYFTKNNPLQTPEWASWQASMRDPRITGRWLVSATQPGAGKFFGEMTITPEASPIEFKTTTKLTSVKTGKTVTFTGKMIVYGGFAWRGRATGSEQKEVREVMSLSRDQASAEGRWFWGFYDEFGYNVKLRRANGGLMISGTDASSLKTGSTGAKVKIYGENFPADLVPADIDLGAGVKVTSIGAKTANSLEVAVDVNAKAVAGPRELVIRGAAGPASIAVYDKVSYIKIVTDSQLARLGGGRYQKGFAQFEAQAFSNGMDGKPNTPDDINLGPVPVVWSMEEFLARYDDDDIQYVGKLDDNGLFTPAIEGPNPKRKFLADNYGDVWVVATYKPAGADKPLAARSYLVVTVPAYVRYDTPEVDQ